MIGDMQKWTPNIASIIEHAKNIYPTQEVISRMVSGKVHRTNYEEVCIRSRKLASALEKDGYKNGDIIATLALNTYRHLEMYYGISGMGAVIVAAGNVWAMRGNVFTHAHAPRTLKRCTMYSTPSAYIMAPTIARSCKLGVALRVV